MWAASPQVVRPSRSENEKIWLFADELPVRLVRLTVPSLAVALAQDMTLYGKVLTTIALNDHAFSQLCALCQAARLLRGDGAVRVVVRT